MERSINQLWELLAGHIGSQTLQKGNILIMEKRKLEKYAGIPVPPKPKGPRWIERAQDDRCIGPQSGAIRAGHASLHPNQERDCSWHGILE